MEFFALFLFAPQRWKLALDLFLPPTHKNQNPRGIKKRLEKFHGILRSDTCCLIKITRTFSCTHWFVFHSIFKPTTFPESHLPPFILYFEVRLHSCLRHILKEEEGNESEQQLTPNVTALPFFKIAQQQQQGVKATRKKTGIISAARDKTIPWRKKNVKKAI